MKKYNCLICGEEIIGKSKTAVTNKFKKHLNNHNIDYKDYIIKYYFNGEVPKCACGCGKECKWIVKNALFSDKHGFSKYYSCTHVNGEPKIEKDKISNYNYICKECNKEFIGKSKTVAQKITRHIKLEHNMSLEEYIVKHYFNGEVPKCACGCGKSLSFHNKNALWNPLESFGKYIHCGHVGKNNKQLRSKLKKYYKSKYDDIEWIKNHYYEQYGKDNIENSAKDFLENNELTNIDISKKYGIDIRTLQCIWYKLSLVTKEQWKERGLYRKYQLSGSRRRKKFENKEIICNVLYNIMKNNPFKYNICSLIEYYNSNNFVPITTDIPVVLDELEKIYGDEIYNYLEYNKHSKEEKKFLDILKFFMKKRHFYKCGLRLQYGENKRQSYIYDICVDNKYIIEYDGVFYHNENNKERDLIKENFAINKGYKFIRISSKDFKNIEIYKHIINFIEND